MHTHIILPISLPPLLIHHSPKCISWSNILHPLFNSFLTVLSSILHPLSYFLLHSPPPVGPNMRAGISSLLFIVVFPVLRRVPSVKEVLDKYLLKQSINMYPSSQAPRSPVLPTLFSVSFQETHRGRYSPSGLWRLWASGAARSTPPVGQRTPQGPAGPARTPTTHSPTAHWSWPSSSATVWCVWPCWRNGLCRPPPTTWWWA